MVVWVSKGSVCHTYRRTLYFDVCAVAEMSLLHHSCPTDAFVSLPPSQVFKEVQKQKAQTKQAVTPPSAETTGATLKETQGALAQGS